MSRADELYMLGRYQEALNEYLKALRDNPDDVKAVAMIANCNTNLRNFDEALRMAKSAVSMEPNYDFAHQTAGIACQNLGHDREAENHFRKAVQLDPEDYQNHVYLGSFLGSKRKFEDAIICLEHARKLNPIASEPLQELSEIYSETGDHDRALKLAIESLELDPDESNSHLALGLSHLSKGDVPAAEKAISEALRIHPKNPRAEYALREAIRSNFPLYRSLAKQSRWVRSQGKVAQTILWIVGFVVIRYLGRELLKNPATRSLGIAIIVLWVLAVVYIFVTPVFANIALLRHPLGKFALNKPQRISSYIIFGFVAQWILVALAALIMRGPDPAAIVAAFGVFFTVGASLFHRSRENQPDVHTVTAIICGIGAVLTTIFYNVT